MTEQDTVMGQSQSEASEPVDRRSPGRQPQQHVEQSLLGQRLRQRPAYYNNQLLATLRQTFNS